MFRQRRLPLLIAAIAVAGTLLGSCQKKSAAPPADSTKLADSTHNAATSGEAKITEVALGKRADIETKKISDPTTVFSTSDTINAVVTTENATQGENIAAKWVFIPSGKVIHEESTALSAGSNTTRFFVTNKKWPAGQYRFEVKVDRDTNAKDFQVK